MSATIIDAVDVIDDVVDPVTVAAAGAEVWKREGMIEIHEHDKDEEEEELEAVATVGACSLVGNNGLINIWGKIVQMVSVWNLNSAVVIKTAAEGKACSWLIDYANQID